MNGLTMLIGCIAAAVSLALLAWVLVQWLRDRGINPFRALAKFIPRSAVERLLLACVAVGFFHWEHGEIFWEIPAGWGELGSVEFDQPAGRLPESATQRAILFDDGTCGVRKFHHQVTRTTNDVVVLDGVVK